MSPQMTSQEALLIFDKLTESVQADKASFKKIEEAQEVLRNVVLRLQQLELQSATEPQ